jgi:hypothetical protein
VAQKIRMSIKNAQGTSKMTGVIWKMSGGFERLLMSLIKTRWLHKLRGSPGIILNSSSKNRSPRQMNRIKYPVQKWPIAIGFYAEVLAILKLCCHLG